jgi:UDP-glucose:glycoprotein glucosyltransferase
LDSRNFRELHGYLYKLSNKPNAHVEYVLRHIPPTHSAEHSSTLSGYGVGLDLKKMDYLALDDRLAKTTAARKQNSEEVQEEEVQEDSIAKLIEAYPENKTASEAQLTKEEFVAIGPQAVQLIADSNDPLETWTTLSQNFPKYAKSIPRRVVANASIVEELASNGQQVQPGMNVMWINGAMLDGKDTEPLGLLRQLRKERGVMQSLTSLGLDREQAMELLTHANISNAQRRGGGITDGLFDASDRQEGGDLIVYWNDFNKDKR